MYIEKSEQISRTRTNRSVLDKRKNSQMLKAPNKEDLIEQYSKDVLMHWSAPEFEMYEVNKRRLSYVALILLAIIFYATFTNNPMMAVVFVLIGIVFYLYLNKEPRILTFCIVPEGVLAGNELYEFENLRSFWIFYDPQNLKVISLHTRNYLAPFVHIPIEEKDPVEIRRILIRYIPEIKQEHNLAEILGRFLGI